MIIHYFYYYTYVNFTLFLRLNESWYHCYMHGDCSDFSTNRHIIQLDKYSNKLIKCTNILCAVNI